MSTREDKELNLSFIIKKIEGRLQMNFGILSELNEWRNIRNKLVHELL